MKGIIKKKVLVVEDEEHICDLIKAYFQEEFQLMTIPNGIEALRGFQQSLYDLVILDLMLPGMNGLDLCRQIRKTSQVPIIMLTAKDEDVDKILGLELGADDYITKPFNPRELLARVKAVLRRFYSKSEESTSLIYPGMLINKETREVQLEGQQIDLTPKEFDLLWLFASNPGMVFSREHLITKLWGYDYTGETRTIDNTVKRLRRKLEAVPGAPLFIVTVWGVGYKFEVPENEN